MAKPPGSLTAIARKITRIIKITAAEQAKTRRASSAKPAKKIKPLKALKGLTLEQLLKYVPTDRIENAKRDRVTIVQFRIGGKPAGSRIFSKSLTYDTSRGKPDIRPHKHWISKHSEDVDKRFNAARLICHCDCPDHVFSWEYALTHHGASSIKYSNGDPPVFKNTRLHPGSCKHLWTLFRLIQRKKI